MANYTSEQYADLIRRKPHLVPDGVPPHAKRQRNPVDVDVAEDAGEAANKVRCLVRYKSFRTRLCDERNLFDKHFTDALTEASILHDDSPEYCKVEVEQIQVASAALERTEITVEPMP